HVLARFRVLIFGSEQNPKAGLGEASPNVVHQVGIDQHAHRILEFHVVLDDERLPTGSADEWRVSLHPLPGLPEVVGNDLDVGGCHGSRSTAEHDSLAGGLQTIAMDFVGTVLSIADAGTDGVRVGAASYA